MQIKENIAEEEIQETEDPWEAAEQAYDEPSGTIEPEGDVVEVQENKIVENVDPYNLDKLRAPHKYKNLIKEHFDPILNEKEAALKTITEEAAQTKTAVSDLINVFKNIAQDPNKLSEYVSQYGEALGLDRSTIDRFSIPQEPQKALNNEQPASIGNLQDITKKYQDRLIQTTDPREFVSILESQNAEILEHVESKMMNNVFNLLRTYHDKYIEPDKQVLNSFKTKAQQDKEAQTYEQTKTGWTSAKTDLISKYPDFKNYESKIIDLIKNDPDFDIARQTLNQNPNDVKGRMRLIEKAYQLVSINDRVKAKPMPTSSGLPPTSKFLSTKKTGGGGWDDSVHSEIWGE